MNIIKELRESIARFNSEIEKIQSMCMIAHIVFDRHNDAGNIMTGREASSWRSCTCSLCDARWEEACIDFIYKKSIYIATTDI